MGSNSSSSICFPISQLQGRPPQPIQQSSMQHPKQEAEAEDILDSQEAPTIPLGEAEGSVPARDGVPAGDRVPAGEAEVEVKETAGVWLEKIRKLV